MLSVSTLGVGNKICKIGLFVAPDEVGGNGMKLQTIFS